MTDTGSYAARKNAKRAAEKMIADGKAPAVDYGITPREDGRFVSKSKPSSPLRPRRLLAVAHRKPGRSLQLLAIASSQPPTPLARSRNRRRPRIRSRPALGSRSAKVSARRSSGR